MSILTTPSPGVTTLTMWSKRSTGTSHGFSHILEVFNILPTFDYCDVIWNGCTKDEETKLERLQNYAARSILRQRKDSSASLARRELNPPTMTSRRKLHLVQHAFKSIQGSHLPYLLRKSPLHPPVSTTITPNMLPMVVSAYLVLEPASEPGHSVSVVPQFGTLYQLIPILHNHLLLLILLLSK